VWAEAGLWTLKQLKNASCYMKKGRDKSLNLIFPGPNPSRMWAQRNCWSSLMHVQISVTDTNVLILFFSFQFLLHVKLFLNTQTVEQVVEIWLVLGAGGVANLVTKRSCAITNLLLSMLFTITKLIISEPHIAVLIISKSWATIFLSFWRRKLRIALCGGTVLEEALDLSSDRLLNEWIYLKEKVCGVFEKLW
jgi:hypothetical protein